MSNEVIIAVIFLFVRFGVISYFPGTYLIYHYLKSNKGPESKTKESKMYFTIGVALNIFGAIITYFSYNAIEIIEAWYLINLIWFSVFGIVFTLYMKSKI